MSSAIAQRIELTGTPFNDGEVLSIGHEQIMLLLGYDSYHGVPLRREYGAILVLVRSCPRRYDLGARLACLGSHGPNHGLAQPVTCVSFRILGQKLADGYAGNGSPAHIVASWCLHRRPAPPINCALTASLPAEMPRP